MGNAHPTDTENFMRKRRLRQQKSNRIPIVMFYRCDASYQTLVEVQLNFSITFCLNNLSFLDDILFILFHLCQLNA
ncbi:MAG TPA: hypothetical protein DEF48_25160 [Nostoc sp. UBA8866]|nr:hypothetical protein [Nostoc sp. UBA8866]